MEPLVNSLDAVSERDFALDLLYACAMLGVHLSRLGEEWVLWTSSEFGFARLDDAYSSGSSIMPQKKNPDAYELMRGKTGRLIGNLNALLVTLKGLPPGYSKDLQEDKEPLFDSVDSILGVLAVLPEMLRTASFDGARMAETAGGFATRFSRGTATRSARVPGTRSESSEKPRGSPGSASTGKTTTSRSVSSTPAASQPRIIGSRSGGRPTPRSDHRS